MSLDKIVCENWFPTKIYYKDLKNFKLINKKLLQYINKDKSKNIVRSNINGWHSQSNLHLKKEFNIITNELFKMQNEIYNLENYSSKTRPTIEEMWVNINYQNCYNQSHIHSHCLWSGVYYIKCPENCGDIKFSDPAMQRIFSTPLYENNIDQSKLTHKAIEGRLIMFPGWLSHEVEINKSKSPRVSLSFNFTQTYAN